MTKKFTQCKIQIKWKRKPNPHYKLSFQAPQTLISQIAKAQRDKVCISAKKYVQQLWTKIYSRENVPLSFSVTLLKGKKYKYFLVLAWKCLNFKIRIVEFISGQAWLIFLHRAIDRLRRSWPHHKDWASKAFSQTSCWSPALLPPQIKHLKVLKTSYFTLNIFYHPSVNYPEAKNIASVIQPMTSPLWSALNPLAGPSPHAASSEEQSCDDVQ